MLTWHHNQDAETPAWPEMFRLTAQEHALLRLVVQGHAPEQAAGALGVTAAEARDTLNRLQERSGALCLRALVVRAILEGWVEADQGCKLIYGISARLARVSRWQTTQRDAAASQKITFWARNAVRTRLTRSRVAPTKAAMSLWVRLTSMRTPPPGRVSALGGGQAQQEAGDPARHVARHQHLDLLVLLAQPLREDLSSDTAMPGWSRMACRQASPSSRARSVGSTLVTSAARGWPSSRLISPKKSPALRISRITSSPPRVAVWTLTRPAMMT